MKRYQVYYENKVESSKVAEFDTIEQAKEYMTEETRGCEYAGKSHPDNDLAMTFRYAAYDSTLFDEENGFGEPVAETDCFWE